MVSIRRIPMSTYRVLTAFLMVIGILGFVDPEGLGSAGGGGSPPEVLEFILPDEIQVGVEQNGIVRFQDPDGDIVTARFEVVEGDRTTIQIWPDFEFDPQVQGRTRGRFFFRMLVTQPQRVTLRLILADAAGNRSPPKDKTFKAVGESPQPQPMLQVEPSTLRFQAVQGRPEPDPQTLEITNAGGEVLNWTASTDAAWLHMRPDRGTLSAGESRSVAVEARVAGLSVGTHSATIIVTAPGAQNSPQRVAVALEIIPPRGNQPPIARFRCTPSRPLVGQVISCDASASSDPDGRIVRYEWDFGDGTSQTAEAPVVTHAYRRAGLFRVGLVVTDDQGLRSTPAEQEVTVTAPPTGGFVLLKVVDVELLEPQDWERTFQAGCMIYTNISAAASTVRVTLPDGSTQEFQVPAGGQVIICGDIVHIDTRQ